MKREVTVQNRRHP